MQNLNTTGTFEDYIWSINAEIIRLLGTPPEGEKYWVEVKDGDWGPGTGPVRKITISDGTAFTSFSIAKCEFAQNNPSQKRLKNLAEARFQNAIEDLKDMVEGPNLMIRKLSTVLEPAEKISMTANKVGEECHLFADMFAVKSDEDNYTANPVTFRKIKSIFGEDGNSPTLVLPLGEAKIMAKAILEL